MIGNYKKLIFYGAGEVCELLLNTIKEDYDGIFEVIAIIDDNESKHGLTLVQTPITSFEILNRVEHDAVLVTSYTNQKEILKKLDINGYDKNKILYFFK